jgi:hypothetical protein
MAGAEIEQPSTSEPRRIFAKADIPIAISGVVPLVSQVEHCAEPHGLLTCWRLGILL